MEFNIEDYLNSLSKDVLEININYKDLTYLSPLSS
jgi:hypothetical protein